MGEVEIESVRLVDEQVRMVRHLRPESGCKAPIYLDDMQLAARREQREGECAVTGSDSP